MSEASPPEQSGTAKSEVPGTALFEGSPDCVKLLDPDGRVLAVNENGQCLMEIEDFGAIARKNWFEIWPEGASDKIKEALDVARSGGRKQFHAFCPTAKGTPKWWDVSVAPIYGIDGRLNGILSISRDITALRRANEEVQASRERFLLLLESSAEGIFGLDTDGRCTFLNASGSRMLGYQPDELIGRMLPDVIHQRNADGSPFPESACHLLNAARAGESIRAEDEVFWHKDGSSVPVAYSVSPMILNGQNTGAVVNFTNIADRKKAEAERLQLAKEVQAASDRMAEVFKQAPAIMCILRGPDHIFELVNQQYLQLVGRRDPIGLTVREALPEMEGQGLFELLDHVFQTGRPFSGNDIPVRIQRNANAPLEQRFLDLAYMALRDSDGKVTGILVHGIDQTHRKQAEAEIYESRERFQKVFSQAATGVVQADAEGRIVLVNRRFCEMMGYDEGELLGKNVEEITAPEYRPDTLAAVGKLVSGECSSVVLDKHYLRKDGTILLATSHVNALHGPNGENQGLVSIIIDVTESQRATERLRASEERYRTVFESMDQGFCIIEMMFDELF